MPTLIDHLRFRMASSPARREAAKNACLVALILGAYAIAGTLDYQDELASEAIAQERHAIQQAALQTCLNSPTPGSYTLSSGDGYHIELHCDLYPTTGRKAM